MGIVNIACISKERKKLCVTMLISILKSSRKISNGGIECQLQSVTKIIETHYIFIKKVHKKTLGLVIVTQNAPFPLTQCCTKPEEAMPGSQDQKSVDKLATNIE